MPSRGGVEGRLISETPLAVVDLETTGLAPGGDRVVEISVVRHDPGREPETVLDTLVNPERRVAATEIHGITDADVEDAPRFADIAGDVVDALSGAVVAAYNVYFDEPFLSYELGRQRIRSSFPHVCLMYMRPMLGLGKRCRLDAACAAHGVAHASAHVAAADAEAASRLLVKYLEAMRGLGVRTFGDLARLKAYKFVSSFARDSLDPSAAAGAGRGARPKSRRPAGAPAATTGSAMAAYWDELAAVLSDLEVTEEELDGIAALRAELGLSDEQVRVLHARAMATAINECVEDEWLDDSEAERLGRLAACLSRLGWSPGEGAVPGRGRR